MIMCTSIFTSDIGLVCARIFSRESNFVGTTGKLRIWSLNSPRLPARFCSAWWSANASSVLEHPKIVMSKEILLFFHSSSQKMMFWEFFGQIFLYIYSNLWYDLIKSPKFDSICQYRRKSEFFSIFSSRWLNSTNVYANSEKYLTFLAQEQILDQVFRHFSNLLVII